MKKIHTIKSKLLTIFMALTLILSLAPLSAAAEDTPAFVIAGNNCNAGEEVAVTVALKNNPGIVSILLDIKYDSSYFKLKRVEDAGIFGDSLHSDNYNLNPYVLCWANDLSPTNFTINGVIATLYFEVAEHTPAGSYPISILYDLDNYDCFDCNLDPVYFDVENGYINVISGGSGVPEEPEVPAEPEPTSGIAVTFMKHNGQELEKKFITDTHSVTAPRGAFVYGYGFKNWATTSPNAVPTANEGDMLTEGEVMEDTTFTPKYGLSKREYTITVDGGVLENGETSGKFRYNEKVTVKHGEATDNHVFGYWSKNDEIVSYDDTYSFYAGESVTVKAVYLHVTTAFDKVPAVAIEMPVMITYEDMIGFAAEKYVPAGYTLNEFGIIMADRFSEDAPFTLDSGAQIIAKSSGSNAKNQFTARKKDVMPGDIWYARAYLIYKNNTTGEQNIIYSRVVGTQMP